jgi:hypothetical protein
LQLRYSLLATKGLGPERYHGGGLAHRRLPWHERKFISKHVTGIGGFFFRLDDHKALAKWYNDHFSINDQENGWIWQQDAGPTVFSPFKRDSDYFDAKQQFMLNLRCRTTMAC